MAFYFNSNELHVPPCCFTIVRDRQKALAQVRKEEMRKNIPLGTAALVNYRHKFLQVVVRLTCKFHASTLNPLFNLNQIQSDMKQCLGHIWLTATLLLFSVTLDNSDHVWLLFLINVFASKSASELRVD